MIQLDTIYIYDDPDIEGLDVGYLAGYLAGELPRLRVGVRGDFITHHLGRFSAAERKILEDELARQLAGARAATLLQDDQQPIALPPDSADLEAAYVAQPLQAALRLLVPEDESGMDQLHILLCSDLLAEVSDQPSLRFGIAALGSPSIISTSGLVEAPRKPREYYFRRVQYLMLGAEDHLEELAEQFADRTAGYGDPRINEMLKGYLLMAAIYRALGDGPCTEPTCPLYAARTQTELLQAQTGPESRLCPHHAEMLDAIGGMPLV